MSFPNISIIDKYIRQAIRFRDDLAPAAARVINKHLCDGLWFDEYESVVAGELHYRNRDISTGELVMPFKSKAQRRYMYAKHPEIAEDWEEETPKGKKLPEKKRRKAKKRARK